MVKADRHVHIAKLLVSRENLTGYSSPLGSDSLIRAKAVNDCQSLLLSGVGTLDDVRRVGICSCPRYDKA